METLSGALLVVWIVVCILIGIFFSTASLGSLCCTFDPPENTERIDAFACFVLYGFVAGLFYIHVWCLMSEDKQTPEPSKTRDILLTVPEKSSVNAQVTSENNTVNISNL